MKEVLQTFFYPYFLQGNIVFFIFGSNLFRDVPTRSFLIWRQFTTYGT